MKEESSGKLVKAARKQFPRIGSWLDWAFSKGLTLPVLGAILLVVAGSFYYDVPLGRVLLGPAESFKQAELRDAAVQRYLDLGNSFLNIGRPDAAKTEYEQALKLDSNNVQGQLGFRLSEMLAENEAGWDPTVRQAYLERFSNEESGFFEGSASEEVQKFNDSNKSHILVALGQASIHSNPEQASEYFREAARINPENSLALTQMGTLHTRQNEREKALEMFQKAFDIAPWHTVYQNNLASALTDNKRYEEAAQQYEDLIKKDPQLVTTYFGMSRVYRAQNQLSKANYYQRQAIELLDTEDVASLPKNKGWMLFYTDPELSPVDLFYESEKKYYAYFSMAFTSYLLGKAEEANGYLDQARDLQVDVDSERKIKRLIKFEIQTLREEWPEFETKADDFSTRFL